LAAPSATDPPAAWRDLEYGGRIRGVTIKRHACCGHTIAAADAALELVARGVDLDDVVSSEVVTYSTAVEVADRPRPRSVQDAKFSLQYCVAAALVLGALNQDAFSAERRACPAIARLMRMTRVHAAADYDAVHPQRCARVTLNYADGTSVVAERFTRVGDPDDPLTDDQLHAKFMRLASPGLGRAAAESLMSAVWHADGSESVHAIDWPVVVAR
jgi:2-methylcitrate dehydratase PrpD